MINGDGAPMHILPFRTAKKPVQSLTAQNYIFALWQIKKIWSLADLSSMVAREVLGLKVDNFVKKTIRF